MLKKSAQEIQNVVDELELAVMMDKIDLSKVDHSFMSNVLESCIWALAEIDRRDLTLHEVFEKVDDSLIDLEVTTYSDQVAATTLEELYKVWANFEQIVAREDNVLNWVDDSSDWKVGYKKSLANLIAVHGSPVSLAPSHYGWVDYDLMNSEFNQNLRYKHVAVFNVKEDYWSEFNGTFNTDDDSHSGMVADVIYSTGISRKVRYEGTMSEIMKDMGI